MPVDLLSTAALIVTVIEFPMCARNMLRKWCAFNFDEAQPRVESPLPHLGNHCSSDNSCFTFETKYCQLVFLRISAALNHSDIKNKTTLAKMPSVKRRSSVSMVSYKLSRAPDTPQSNNVGTNPYVVIRTDNSK